MTDSQPGKRTYPFHRRYGVFLIAVIATALLTRFQQFGNPIVHIDEQFYLLVGDRMLSGALPYVDIWDRKPIGLFLIYAAVRELGGSGILQYQLVATVFAIATALCVERLASRIADARGAMLAALLYLLWIPLLTGQGGQSPVFYNLLVAGAALSLCRAAEAASSALRLFGWGLVAMLAVGVALQIKTSPIFEGLFFGVTLLWLAWKARHRASIVIAMAVAWVLAALLPTIAAGMVYWRIGHFDAFWFSNFVSIFQRHDLDKGDVLRNAATLSLYLSPLLILAAHGAKLRYRRSRDLQSSFPTLWLITATVAVVIFGYYFDHYGLPIVVPAAVSAATVLDRRRRPDWPLLVMIGALAGCLLLPTFNQRRRGTPAQFARLVDVLKPLAPRGLLVWDNLSALYYVLNAPLPTRYPFPTHLRDRNEVGAIGIDQPRELTRILDGHPEAIVMERGKPHAVITQTTAMLRDRVADDYHLVATIRVGRRDQLVYAWNGAPSPGAER